MKYSFWMSRPASSAMSSHFSGTGPMQKRKLFQCIFFGISTSSLRDPGFLPGQRARVGILEEPVQRDVRTAQEIDPAIEVRPLGRGVETELAHAEPGLEAVAPVAGLENVEERVLGRPQARVRDLNRIAEGADLAGLDHILRGLEAPALRPSFQVVIWWANRHSTGAAPWFAATFPRGPNRSGCGRHLEGLDDRVIGGARLTLS